MLSILGNDGRLCDGLTRREWLRLGGLSALGVSLPALLQARAASAAAGGVSANTTIKAKSCIVLFMLGGPPQHETWDPKPDAPIEFRGNLAPISSAVPGFQVGELMPRVASMTDKICALRAVQTRDNAHSTSGYAMSTGVPHRPLGVEFAKPGPPNDWPCLGGIVRSLRADVGGLPAAITLPEVAANDGNKTWPGQNAGWLGRSADPWLLTCNPSAADFQVPGLSLPREVPPLRFTERQQLLRQFDGHLASVEQQGVLETHDTWHQQAFGLLTSSAARHAFDVSREPNSVRDRYGRTRFGQSVLLARRLVEAGVSLVQVNWARLPNALNNGHWDTHQKNAEALQKHLMPVMDQTYSALLEDLNQRGLLDETLVVWMGEFGRSPKINAAGGRDHWGSVFSIAMAGGGVQGGQIYGASDRLGGEPHAGRLTAADVAATIFHALGYRPETRVRDILNRPLAISQGQPVEAIF